MKRPNGRDAFEEATDVVEAAIGEGVPIRLVGGLAVRHLCPDFPPRARDDQDMDFASVSRARAEVNRFFTDRGFVADKQFNNLHGHKQLYFATPDGRTADVLVDRLSMCHVLDFRDRIERMSHTLDVTDLLLSKLQIVELNQKDLQDVVYLLAAFPVVPGDQPGTIGLARFGKILGDDWGWWRTVTRNLERVAELASGDLAHLVPPGPPFDPVAQARGLRQHADAAPKSFKWRLRSKVGERLRWYEVPEEVAHD